MVEKMKKDNRSAIGILLSILETLIRVENSMVVINKELAK